MIDIVKEVRDEVLNDTLNYKLMLYTNDFSDASLPKLHSNRKTKRYTLY